MGSRIIGYIIVILKFILILLEQLLKYPQSSFKLIFASIVFSIYLYLRKNKKNKFPEGDDFIYQYRFKSLLDKWVSFVFVALYLIFLFFGILMLRLYRYNHILDLNPIKTFIIVFYKQNSWLVLSINLFFIASICIIFLFLLRRLYQWFSKRFIKTHLYMSNTQINKINKFYFHVQYDFFIQYSFYWLILFKCSDIEYDLIKIYYKYIKKEKLTYDTNTYRELRETIRVFFFY